MRELVRVCVSVSHLISPTSSWLCRGRLHPRSSSSSPVFTVFGRQRVRWLSLSLSLSLSLPSSLRLSPLLGVCKQIRAHVTGGPFCLATLPCLGTAHLSALHQSEGGREAE